MASISATVTGTIVDGEGSAITSAIVKAQRIDPHPAVAATLNADDTTSATSNSSTGIFSLSLTGNSAFPVTYKITLPDGQYFYLNVPANAESTGLGIITCGRGPAKSRKNITSNFSNVKWIGQDLASAAALPEPTCDIHNVTGTTAITSITATNFPVGKEVTLIFAGVLTFTAGNNLEIAGNFTTSALDSISLVYDGSVFYEKSRSANA